MFTTNNKIVFINRLECDNFDNEYATQPYEYFSGIVLSDNQFMSEDLCGWSLFGEYGDKDPEETESPFDLIKELATVEVN